jgi:superfamily II DNA or RNA helicase
MSKLVVTGTIKIPFKLVTAELLDAYTYRKITYNDFETVTNYYKTNAHILLPRRLDKLKKLLPLSFEYNLVTSPVTSGRWNTGYGLYDYQQPFVTEIVKSLKSDVNCLGQALTRFGKTACAVGVMLELKQKTLVLVDKTLLVDQFVSDTKEYSNLNVSKLAKGQPTTDVTVTTFQFLNANKQELKRIKNDFGLVIVDELHVSAATTYKRIIQSFPSRYRLGLTATPSRSSDGLSEVLYDLFGKVKVTGKNPTDMLVNWTDLKVQKEYHRDTFRPSAAYDKFFKDPDVVDLVIRDATRFKGRTIMIATNSKLIQNLYTKKLEELGFSVCVFNSETVNKREQDSNMLKVSNGDIEVFAGLNVLLKGVSIPRLSVIYNLMSVSSVENLTQLVGRLKTKMGNKPQPLFVNVVPKYTTFKTRKVTDLLYELENVERLQ